MTAFLALLAALIIAVVWIAVGSHGDPPWSDDGNPGGLV